MTSDDERAMAKIDTDDRALGKRVHRLYWESQESVNSIADELGLSKGRLYDLLRPLPSGERCPRCGGELAFENRTAREHHESVCLSCGAEQPGTMLETAHRALSPRAAVESLGAPLTGDPRAVAAGLLIGGAAGILLGRFLKH